MTKAVGGIRRLIRGIRVLWRAAVRIWRIMRGTALVLTALVLVASDLRIHTVSRWRRCHDARRAGPAALPVTRAAADTADEEVAEIY